MTLTRALFTIEYHTPPRHQPLLNTTGDRGRESFKLVFSGRDAPLIFDCFTTHSLLRSLINFRFLQLLPACVTLSP